ncbi:succinyl-diaminopimelate desuccinylase [Helicobacter turcicus]|uniref:Succinyl-diaminopimelate desuccinylase n=1 Tax=Helicobacter turcicus TaxID=2867412 RepID=A0ABS7JKN2_9HELI|nr:succinyl-diaminopimelate desuccinylase [Helicobacter turcicus]MBX7489941.1 succinyl-diaminopimelate desuccinylase [Helicobacter turcicus]MBX7544800.1 succinyl-diaminopimelate desuccinylase [Helicobacter turcicus]
MQTQNTQTIEVLKQLIAYPSVTPQECGIYKFIREILPEFRALEFDKNGVKNVFLYKDFAQSQNIESKPVHLCFAGHIDVVPAGEGWESDPFVPLEKDGFLYGRGAQDMKGGVAAFVCAIREFLDSNAMFNGILSVLLTSDEEGDAVFGTKYVLEELQKIDLLPNFAVVAEPTCVEKFGDMIKVGRRGSINGKLIILGKQGHVAYPSKCVNPVELIAPVLSRIAGFDLDKGSVEFEPSKIVITDIRGGMEVVNVTPNTLKIMFNVRNSTLTHLEDLQTYLENLLKAIPHHLELKQSSKPFLTDTSNKIVQKMQEVLELQNGFAPILSTSGGTSDARYFAEFGVSVVECGVCNDRIHSLNERVRISEVIALQKSFLELLHRF